MLPLGVLSGWWSHDQLFSQGNKHYDRWFGLEELPLLASLKQPILFYGTLGPYPESSAWTFTLLNELVLQEPHCPFLSLGCNWGHLGLMPQGSLSLNFETSGSFLFFISHWDSLIISENGNQKWVMISFFNTEIPELARATQVGNPSNDILERQHVYLTYQNLILIDYFTLLWNSKRTL